jgi:molybdopterin converting factor small subunit
MIKYVLLPHPHDTMSSQSTITVLYFAAASTATGLTSQTVSLPSSLDIPSREFRLSSLPELLLSLHPNRGLDKILQSSRWSVDAEMVDDPQEVVLKGGEEVAVICPVSGG